MMRDIHLTPFYGNTFDCTHPLLPKYEGQDPEPGEQSFAGIDLYRAGTKFIGQEGQSVNDFRNIRNGILVNTINLEVVNSKFENIQKGEYDDSGFGIKSIGNGSFFRQKGFGKFEEPSFIDVNTGIWSSNNMIDFIKDNNMENVFFGVKAMMSIGKVEIIRNQILLEQQTPNPVENEIGIYYNDSASPVNLLIDDNDVYGPSFSIGIYCNKASGESPSDAVVSNNDLFFYGVLGFIGIHAIESDKLDITFNNIIAENVGHRFTGISIELSEKVIVNCNNITGSGPNTDKSKGIDVISCPRYALICNNVHSTREGIVFDGDCFSDDTFMGNTFENHRTGLAIKNDAQIGTQLNRGNQWFGEDEEYADVKARHEQLLVDISSQDFVLNSQFEVNSFPNGIFNPNLFPEFEAIAENWFVPTDEPEVYECEESPQICPIVDFSPNFTNPDIKIAIGEFDDATDNPLTLAEYKRNLFKKINNPAFFDEVTLTEEEVAIYSDFLSFEMETNIGKYESLENNIAALWDLTNTDYQNLQENFNQLISKANELVVINQELDESNGADSLDLINQRNQILMAMNELSEANEIILNDIGESRTIQAEVLKEENTGLNGEFIFEEAEQLFNEVYLSTLPNGIIDFNSEQVKTLEKVAYQCPDVWGPAVYKARALLSLKYYGIFDDTELCENEAQNYFSNAVNTFEVAGLKLTPNPAKEQVQIDFPFFEESGKSLQIFNVSGQLLQKIDLANESQDYRLSLESYEQGVFWVRYLVEGQIRGIEKLVIIK